MFSYCRVQSLRAKNASKPLSAIHTNVASKADTISDSFLENQREHVVLYVKLESDATHLEQRQEIILTYM